MVSDSKTAPPVPRGTVDLNRSTVSRYIQLSTLFRRRIESGVWRPGHRIPTVDELAAEYGWRGRRSDRRLTRSRQTA